MADPEDDDPEEIAKASEFQRPRSPEPGSGAPWMNIEFPEPEEVFGVAESSPERDPRRIVKELKEQRLQLRLRIAALEAEQRIAALEKEQRNPTNRNMFSDATIETVPDPSSDYASEEPIGYIPLPRELVGKLTEINEFFGLPAFSDVVRVTLDLGLLLVNQMKKGDKILVRSKRGVTSEVLLEKIYDKGKG